MIVGIIILLTFIGLILYYYTLPVKDLISVKEIPKSYFINSPNRIDFQSRNECAAYSAAYVLRHFNIEAQGNNIYKGFPYKLIDGTIAPKGIIKYLKKAGLSAGFCRGSIETLKKQLSKGIPVIAFIRVYPNKRYLHYVPVVGYDEKYIYLADSLKFMVNSSDTLYNRKVDIKDFCTLWRTWIPMCNNTYFIINKN